MLKAFPGLSEFLNTLNLLLKGRDTKTNSGDSIDSVGGSKAQNKEGY